MENINYSMIIIDTEKLITYILNIMATALIDWLYIDDETKQGALVLFPRMIDRWNVSAIITSKWENYNVVVVTDHGTEFMETISNTPDLNGNIAKWTDKELIPFMLINYSDFQGINRALHNTEIDIILFDDTRMLATIAPKLNFDSVAPKIIVLTSWGDTFDQLNIVTSSFPNIRLLTLDLINDVSDINWKSVTVPMSQHQLKYYDKIKSREDIDKSIIPYPMTRMITLYAYPEAIMADTLAHRSICETNQTDMPDNIDMKNSWLNSSYIDSLEEDGPKLQSVLDGIISNWPSKQLIITRFNHRYGVDLIVSFLRLMNINMKNPYELNEIIHTSCTDDYEVSIIKFHKFNNLESGILITNIIPLIPLKGISVIHVVDSYSFLNIKMVLDRCHKRYLNKSATNLDIYSYIATHPIYKSADQSLQDTFIMNIKEADRIYTGLISQGGHIVFNPQTGLLVQNI
jgi:hypothetical protein